MNKQYFIKILIPIFCCFLWLTLSFTNPSTPLPDSPALLYANQVQEDLTLTFKSAIKNAKKSILLVTYTLREQKIVQLLKKRAKEGVHIEVIVDPKASPFAKKQLGKNIITHYRHCKGIMHQKILIVDNSLVWMGSANMTNESLRFHGNLVIGFNHPEVAHFIKDRMDLLLKTPIKKTPIGFNRKKFKLKQQKTEVWFLPDQGESKAKILQLLKTAKKTIQVGMFTWTHKELSQALIDAKKKGIKVEVVMDRNSAKGTSQVAYQTLKNEQIPVRLNRSAALLHHKFALIDNEILINGSTNWTNSAFTRNDECFMILYKITPTQRHTLQKLWRVLKLESYIE